MEDHEHYDKSPKSPSKPAAVRLPSSQKYWRSLGEWQKSKEWTELVDREFKNSPFFDGEVKESWNRRDFMKLMGASLALGSAACIRRPVQKIIPYINRPIELIPGVANYYASSWCEGTQGYGFVVKTREGRPIKLEGNPEHPVNGGALSARAQAQVLNLYDPDRVSGPRKVVRAEAPAAERKEGEAEPTEVDKYFKAGTAAFRNHQEPAWQQVDTEIIAKLKEGGVYLLTSSISSPSTNALIGDFKAQTGATHLTWDPIGYDHLASAQKSSFGGSAVVPRYALHRSKMTVAIDADFLGTFLSPVEFNRDWAATRRPSKDMGKLAVFESTYTLTGANADARFKIKPSQQIEVAMGLIFEVSQVSGKGAGVASSYANAAQKLGLDQALFKQIAKDLWDNRGKSLVIAGDLATRTEQGEALQTAVNFLNSLLGNDGITVDYAHAPFKAMTGSYENLQTLIEKMNSGSVKTLIIHGLNPAYAASADSGFIEALAKVGTVVTTADRVDETGVLAHYVLPDHHHLENWGDGEVQASVFSVQQPTIRPLYNTRAFQDSLLIWGNGVKGTKPATWFSYLKDNWKKHRFHGGGAFDNAWTQLLKLGVLDMSADLRERVATARGFNGASLKIAQAPSREGFELALYESSAMGDGRWTNNSWLMEMPDPVTKVSWGNPLQVSPNTAKKLGLIDGTVVRLSVNKKSIETPIVIQPGLHDDVVALAVGYGRTRCGSVADGVGINGFDFVQFNKGKPVFSGLSAQIEKTDKFDQVATMQEHANIEGRQIIVEASLANYLKKPDTGIHREEIFSIWNDHKYDGPYRWGMAIDLNTCTGCSACIIACQAENNTPTVGKRFVMQGREMHWMRVDRYYSGSTDNPQGTFQPMLCQHCENAPCETVCPVAATTHSPEGLNEMTYNRCVGTRYCSNNCPFKVRRFNWFNYSQVPEPKASVLNPDVTVRSRGVMEKCSFCIQRIHVAKNNAKDRGDTVKDGEIKTACQQTCPTNAINFGNINDPASEVRKWQAEPRAFALLEEFNVKPSIRYLTKIRNGDVHSDTHGEEGSHV